MCSPTLILAGLGAAMSAVSIVQQQKQAEAIGKSQAAQAISMRNQQQAALAAQAIQEQRQSSQQATAADMEAARTAAEARVSAGESGITGAGVNRLLGEIGRQATENQAVAESNLTGRIANINMQRSTLDTDLDRQLDQINESMQPPSALSQALSIGSGALSGYQMGMGAEKMFGSGESFFDNLSSFIQDPGAYQAVSNRGLLADMTKTGNPSKVPLALELMGLNNQAKAAYGAVNTGRAARQIGRSLR